MILRSGSPILDIVKEKRYSNRELKHHGVKGMRWGIRRTAEELGHDRKGKSGNLTCYSPKGFKIERKKIVGFHLRPGAKHSRELFDTGYKPEDARKLFKDIEREYDMSKAFEWTINKAGYDTFSIPMPLGVNYNIQTVNGPYTSLVRKI